MYLSLLFNLSWTHYCRLHPDASACCEKQNKHTLYWPQTCIDISRTFSNSWSQVSLGESLLWLEPFYSCYIYLCVWAVSEQVCCKTFSFFWLFPCDIFWRQQLYSRNTTSVRFQSGVQVDLWPLQLLCSHIALHEDVDRKREEKCLVCFPPQCSYCEHLWTSVISWFHYLPLPLVFSPAAQVCFTAN